jgi:hypothetical protein
MQRQSGYITLGGSAHNVEDVDMKYGARYGMSPWYVPGDWVLPKWWTDNPPAREQPRLTHDEQAAYFSSPFVVNVLGHKGGISTLPTRMDME